MHGRAFPLVGISTSVPGLANGPLFIYLLALPLALGRDVALAAAFVALLNVAAIAIVAWLVRSIAGELAALLGAAAFAVGSWPIYVSRKIWPNDAMPLFVAGLLVGLYLATVRQRPAGVILSGFCLGLLLNLHPSSVIFVPLVAAALLMRPRLIATPAAALGALAVAVVSLPYLWHEVTLGFPGMRALRQVTGAAAAIDASAVPVSLALVGPGAFSTVLGDVAPSIGAVSLPERFVAAALPAALALGLLGAGGRAVVQWRRGGEWRGWCLLALWLLVPIAAASRRSIKLELYYLIPTLPALFALVGVGLALPFDLTPRTWWPVRAIGAASAAAVVTVAALVQVGGYERFLVAIRAEGAATVYRTPLIYSKQAVDTALAAAPGRPIALITRAEPGGGDDVPPVWEFLVGAAAPLRLEDGGGLVRLSGDDALYVVAPSADKLAVDRLGQVGRPVAEPVVVPGLPRPYSYWRVPPAGSDPRPRAIFDGWLALDGMDAPETVRPGETISISATWRILGPPPSSELGLFTHIVDDGGRPVAGRDRGGLFPAGFAPGDRLLSWAAMTLPAGLEPGRYWLRTGIYRVDGTVRLRVSDPHGQAIGDAAVFGPLRAPQALPTNGELETPIAAFDDGIDLLEATATRQPTGRLAVALRWRAAGVPRRDYTVFVHGLDGTGRLVAQADSQPRAGRYPTSIWRPPEVVTDRYEIPGAGIARVRVGLYDAGSGERLQRRSGGDSVTIDVTAEPG